MIDYAKKLSFFQMLGRIVREKGIFYFAIKTFYKLIFPIYLKIVGKRTFIFKNKKLVYFNHSYNAALANERAVEISICLDFISNSQKILEIGNVLSHYVPINWEVLDKYEPGKGVINEDVVAFKSNSKYDLIVSVSTFEHIGFDEKIKDVDKPKKALQHLRKFLTKKGVLVITIPYGWNPDLDKMILNKEILFNELFVFKRISWGNIWIKTKLENLKNVKYGKPYIGANGLIVGVIKNGN